MERDAALLGEPQSGAGQSQSRATVWSIGHGALDRAPELVAVIMVVDVGQLVD